MSADVTLLFGYTEKGQNFSNYINVGVTLTHTKKEIEFGENVLLPDDNLTLTSIWL